MGTESSRDCSNDIAWRFLEFVFSLYRQKYISDCSPYQFTRTQARFWERNLFERCGDKHCLLETFRPRMLEHMAPFFGLYAKYIVYWWPGAGQIQAHLSKEMSYWDVDPSEKGFVLWGTEHTRMILLPKYIV